MLQEAKKLYKSLIVEPDSTVGKQVHSFNEKSKKHIKGMVKTMPLLNEQIREHLTVKFLEEMDKLTRTMEESLKKAIIEAQNSNRIEFKNFFTMKKKMLENTGMSSSGVEQEVNKLILQFNQWKSKYDESIKKRRRQDSTEMVDDKEASSSAHSTNTLNQDILRRLSDLESKLKPRGRDRKPQTRTRSRSKPGSKTPHRARSRSKSVGKKEGSSRSKSSNNRSKSRERKSSSHRDRFFRKKHARFREP
jgi:hypothetical protein